MIDECLHESLVGVVHAAGFEAMHVNHLGLSGKPDWELAERIVKGLAAGTLGECPSLLVGKGSRKRRDRSESKRQDCAVRGIQSAGLAKDTGAQNGAKIPGGGGARL
jgi:hypothetical protein